MACGTGIWHGRRHEAPEHQLALKREERLRRARLPFPEKIRIVVELQKRRAPIVKLRGKQQIIWDLGEDDSPKS